MEKIDFLDDSSVYATPGSQTPRCMLPGCMLHRGVWLPGCMLHRGVWLPGVCYNRGVNLATLEAPSFLSGDDSAKSHKVCYVIHLYRYSSKTKNFNNSQKKIWLPAQWTGCGSRVRGWNFQCMLTSRFRFNFWLSNFDLYENVWDKTLR